MLTYYNKTEPLRYNSLYRLLNNVIILSDECKFSTYFFRRPSWALQSTLPALHLSIDRCLYSFFRTNQAIPNLISASPPNECVKERHPCPQQKFDQQAYSVISWKQRCNASHLPSLLCLCQQQATQALCLRVVRLSVRPPLSVDTYHRLMRYLCIEGFNETIQIFIIMRVGIAEKVFKVRGQKSRSQRDEMHCFRQIQG